jgi:RNA-directed DNA polymerase
VVSVLAKVKQIVREYLGSTAHLLINRLNPIVRGWANYHRPVVSKRVFARLHAAIFRMLWGWAQARHPRKGARWIKQKYFDRVGTRAGGSSVTLWTRGARFFVFACFMLLLCES